MCVLVSLWLTIGCSAWALPRFSLLKGEGCALCHTNPSGAGQRNLYGSDVFGAKELPMKRSNAFEATFGEAIRFGGDVRTQLYEVHTETADRYGFFTMQADLYANWQVAEKLSVYVEQDALRGTAELFGMWAPKGHEGYAKLGSFLPNYGLKMDDHTAFVRGGNPAAALKDGLPWAPNYADAGVEVGLELAEIEWTFGAYNGTGIGNSVDARDNDKAFLARGETFLKLGDSRVAVGANVYSNKLPDATDRMNLFGAFVGFAAGSLSVTGEVDIAQNYLPAANADEGATSMAVFTEAVYTVTRGVYALGRFEQFDADMDAQTGNVVRASVGAEIFPVPYVEIKPLVRFNMDSRTAQGSQVEIGDTVEGLTQIHWWF